MPSIQDPRTRAAFAPAIINMRAPERSTRGVRMHNLPPPPLSLAAMTFESHATVRHRREHA